MSKNDRLMERMTRTFQDMQGEGFHGKHADNVVTSLILAAAEFWEEIPDDFCIQGSDSEAAVFGGWNRVVWSPVRGFRLSQSHCTERFIAHFGEVMERRSK